MPESRTVSHDPTARGRRHSRQALADQYAVAADHNRRINLTRTGQRTAAGLFTLGSLLAMLLLVAVI